MRQITDLESNALKFWPEKISELERNSSIIPKLIETQDKFIGILNVADGNPFAWKQVLSSSTMSANLFLKHLMVLSDMGGEATERLKAELADKLENGKMPFSWNGNTYEYQFQSLVGKRGWTNVNLKVDGPGLSTDHELLPIIEDVVNLILFGGSSTAQNIPTLLEEKCTIGSLIGQSEELEAFVKQRYIFVSRITGGAKANSLGNYAQQYVNDYLREKLPNWNFDRKKIPNISQNERTDLSFDLIAASPTGKFCAIEVSFQVTTNSTIERKGGQAQSRQALLHAAGHKIAYVIDGAGNFKRISALRSICQFSDCTVSFKDSELDKLIKFLVSLEE